MMVWYDYFTWFDYTFLEMIAMQKFTFNVDVVADELDRDGVAESIRSCLADSLPGDVHASVKAGEVKAFSEQGYKVWRARVTGVTAEAAGDSANPPKKSKKETETVEA
jgi:hypothetical protein